MNKLLTTADYIQDIICSNHFYFGLVAGSMATLLILIVSHNKAKKND